jgi:hypothetical protein
LNQILDQIKEHPNIDCMDFPNYRFPEIIKMFFDILKGNKIEITESNLDQIYDTIHFLEFGSDSIESFCQNSNILYHDKINLSSISKMFSIPVLESTFLSALISLSFPLTLLLKILFKSSNLLFDQLQIHLLFKSLF